MESINDKGAKMTDWLKNWHINRLVIEGYRRKLIPKEMFMYHWAFNQRMTVERLEYECPDLRPEVIYLLFEEKVEVPALLRMGMEVAKAV
jgi:hypothetical protein